MVTHSRANKSITCTVHLKIDDGKFGNEALPQHISRVIAVADDQKYKRCDCFIAKKNTRSFDSRRLKGACMQYSKVESVIYCFNRVAAYTPSIYFRSTVCVCFSSVEWCAFKLENFVSSCWFYFLYFHGSVMQ